MLNIVARSLLLLGWVPHTRKSISSWGSRGGATLPFSWGTFCWPQHPQGCGKWHEEGSDCPNQTVTSSAGAPGAGARSRPFLRKWHRWWFAGLGKKFELTAFVNWGWERNRSLSLLQGLLTIFSPKLPRSLAPGSLPRAWLLLTEEQWWRDVACDTAAVWRALGSHFEFLWSCHLYNHVCVMLDQGLEDLLHPSKALCCEYHQTVLSFKATMLFLL